MFTPVWTGSKAVVSALQRHLHSVTLYLLLSSLITHLASYFCQSCTTISQGKKAVAVPELNPTLGLHASMTWKQTLPHRRLYSGRLQALRPGFHPLPNGTLLRTLVKSRTTGTPPSPRAQRRQQVISEQEVSSREPSHQLLRHTGLSWQRRAFH